MMLLHIKVDSYQLNITCMMMLLEYYYRSQDYTAGMMMTHDESMYLSGIPSIQVYEGRDSNQLCILYLVNDDDTNDDDNDDDALWL